MRRLIEELLAALAPPVCLACGDALLHPGAPLCVDCRRALPWLHGRRCPRCALPEPCGSRCPARTAAFATAWAPLAYAGPARALVTALKGRGLLAAADAMAAPIAAHVAASARGDRSRRAPRLVPVPSHPSRTRTRGLEPATELARAVARRTNLEVSHALGRRGSPAQQAGAGRAERLAGARLGIELTGARAPDRVLLIDDVHTTGATLDACARTLRDAGSTTVDAVTYARTLRAAPAPRWSAPRDRTHNPA